MPFFQFDQLKLSIMKLLKPLFSIIFLFLFMDAISQPLWMRYPSISPDGKEIVFSYKGDLYRVPSQGGTAIPITIHKAYDYLPVWSPDGKYLAFASNRYGNFDIFLIPSIGGQAKRLTFYSGNEFPNSFTPDGKEVLFSATINDHAKNVQFPSEIISELYRVPVQGERVAQILSTPAEEAKYAKNGEIIIYQDRKGYENIWRKHHSSSVTRDIWMYETNTGKHKKLSTFRGEDRSPVFAASQQDIYYLSEQFGSFNVCKLNLENPEKVTQISHFDKHPVRFLSISDNNLLCYAYDGNIYTQIPGKETQKVNISLNLDFESSDVEFLKMTSGATEMNLSPSGKEIAFIVRGEVFVTSTDYETTKRITNTPEQERSVSFSPDGRTLVYASERNSSWNLYTSTITRAEEKYFASATLLSEKAILEIPAETFQPHFSPDGKEIAYLENRTSLKVIKLANKQTRLILDGKYNYSYSDGDQWYQWSPDGKWFLVSFHPNHWVIGEVGLISSNGTGEVVNLTNSGYSDELPKWTMEGNAMIWFTDRNGLRSHGSWGSHSDAYIMFFNTRAYDKFKLTKEEFELLKEEEKLKKKKTKVSSRNEKEPVEIDLGQIEDQIARLTIHSSSIADAILSPEADKLYYLSSFEKAHDLWMHDLKKNETKLVLKLDGRGGSIQADTAFKYLYVFSDGKMIKIGTKDHKKKSISYSAEMNLNKSREREYMFEHIWRQVKRKWYNPDLHGVDWEFYNKSYSKFLPHINNNFDFAEMLSEMLGELNGSHTGSGYRYSSQNGDQTAKLGALFDDKYNKNGLNILEIFDKSPLKQEGTKIKAGTIIEKIDGEIITSEKNYFIMLNHKAGKPTLLALYDPNTKTRWEETIKPISIRQENQLLYERWVKNRRAETEKLSNGRIGYIHVRAMNSASFRVAYSEILGRNHEKEAIVVDTRFNGGGWLHDDLVSLLSGEKYADYYPGGQYFGSEPIAKWNKPSIILVSESNYSDAHAFPYAYRALNIGKIVGMPVPGTMTAVWWETLQDKSLYFGIPQVGTKDINGNYLENQQLEPDYKVPTDYEIVITGRDQQLEKAVEVMLKELEEGK